MDSIGESATKFLPDLPDEVLLVIFRFLSARQLEIAEQVCLRWKSVVDTCFATTKTLNLYSFKESDGIKRMKRYGVSVHEFIMPSTVEAENGIDWMKEIADAFPNLLSLTLNCLKLEDECMKYFSMKCRKLNSISLMQCTFSDSGLSILLKQLPDLKYLKFENCEASLGKCFSDLGSSVEHLDFHFNSSLEVSSAGASHIFSRCQNLKTLKVSYEFQCNDTLTFSSFCKEKLELIDCPFVDSDLLIRISHHCPNLRSVTICQLPLVSDPGVKCFANCKHLTLLHCNEIGQVTDESLFELAKVGALEDLLISGDDISDRGVIAVLNQCPNLHSLYIDGGSNVGDATVDAAIQAVESRVRLAAALNQSPPAKYTHLAFGVQGGETVLEFKEYLLGLEMFGCGITRYGGGLSHPLIYFRCE